MKEMVVKTVKRDVNYNYENNHQDALYRLIYYFRSALHVSGDVFAHHQEHLTVFTVSGSVHPSCCRLPYFLWKMRSPLAHCCCSTALRARHITAQLAAVGDYMIGLVTRDTAEGVA